MERPGRTTHANQEANCQKVQCTVHTAMLLTCRFLLEVDHSSSSHRDRPRTRAFFVRTRVAPQSVGDFVCFCGLLPRSWPQPPLPPTEASPRASRREARMVEFAVTCNKAASRDPTMNVLLHPIDPLLCSSDPWRIHRNKKSPHAVARKHTPGLWQKRETGTAPRAARGCAPLTCNGGESSHRKLVL